ncbi:UDP-N-acetylmuramoyl-tripeptide--D-alanyl-D-alanine ligase [Kaarinaea lacus]
MAGCVFSIADVAPVLGATIVGDNVSIEGVTTDTRAVEAGQLFVALQGPNFDAHDFVEDAIKAGAKALLVNRKLALDVPQLVVKDTLVALGQMAAWWRSQLSIPFIAVTGSNGKTTVKEMLASIFSQLGSTLATKGNLNNHIGVPLTLLSVEKDHSAAIIEMGANHAGEISYLTNMTRPDVAVINNAAAAHLEGFGSLEGVAKAKGEIYEGLKADGVAVINVDDPFADLWKKLAKKNSQLTFGCESHAGVNKADVSCEWQGDVSGNKLSVHTPEGDFECTLKLLGKHNVMNALAATAVSVGAGVKVEVIKAGLEAVQPVPGRMQQNKGVNGSCIINDTYNANPTSLQAGLAVLAACEGKRILVLGDMGELGQDVEQFHSQAGEMAAKANVDQLFTLGKFSKRATTAFGNNAMHYEDVDRLIADLRDSLTADTTVLVKGSRMMRMERVVTALVES